MNETVSTDIFIKKLFGNLVMLLGELALIAIGVALDMPAWFYMVGNEIGSWDCDGTEGGCGLIGLIALVVGLVGIILIWFIVEMIYLILWFSVKSLCRNLFVLSLLTIIYFGVVFTIRESWVFEGAIYFPRVFLLVLITSGIQIGFGYISLELTKNL